jgi:hypothetical protein
MALANSLWVTGSNLFVVEEHGRGSGTSGAHRRSTFSLLSFSLESLILGFSFSLLPEVSRDIQTGYQLDDCTSRTLVELVNLGQIASINTSLHANPVTSLQTVCLGRDMENIGHFLNGDSLYVGAENVGDIVDGNHDVGITLCLDIEVSLQVIRGYGGRNQERVICSCQA